jgi:hypothetical protein
MELSVESRVHETAVREYYIPLPIILGSLVTVPNFSITS